MSAAVEVQPVKPGIYKHYKGGTYLVLGTFTDEKTKERKVSYVDLKTQQGWHRIESEWFDDVKGGPRFRLLTEVKYPRKTEKGWVIS